jgi:hypothetical protein
MWAFIMLPSQCNPRSKKPRKKKARKNQEKNDGLFNEPENARQCFSNYGRERENERERKRKREWNEIFGFKSYQANFAAIQRIRVSNWDHGTSQLRKM